MYEYSTVEDCPHCGQEDLRELEITQPEEDHKFHCFECGKGFIVVSGVITRSRELNQAEIDEMEDD